MTAALRRRARSLVHILDYTIRLTAWAIRDPAGLRSRTGRLLVWGKIRRSAIVCVPGLGERLRRKHGLAGGCTQCGASCNLLMRCPQWDAGTRLCRIYDSRPPVCRLFPMTPADLREVELSGARCGHRFGPDERPLHVHRR